VFSLELLLVLPIVMIVLLGVVELSLLLMSFQRVQTACSVACQIGTLPATDVVGQQGEMAAAIEAVLGSADMIGSYTVQSDLGHYTGDPVVVQVTVPMSAAAPDLLKIIGISLAGRELTAQMQMCKQ
jgi:Flp pilus assembly protein TadG